jgi:hypothetical protein
MHAYATPKMGTAVPRSITIPDRVDTRIGPLAFFDGFPDDATVERVFDNLDFQRAVQVFLVAMPAASLAAHRKALAAFGPENGTVAIFETLMDSRSLSVTPTTEGVSAMGWLDLRLGPVVVESPPDTRGRVDDAWLRSVDLIPGKLLFVPPGYEEAIPSGYEVFHSKTYGNLFTTRSLALGGDPRPATNAIETHLRIYPLSMAADPPATKFVNVSGKAMSTIAPMDFTFFEELDAVVQEEPYDAVDRPTLALLASIGIEKGSPFMPDLRMTQILSEAATVGNATARALAYRSRSKDAYVYSNSAWCTPFAASNVTPAGSVYVAAFVDSQSRPFDGSKTYRLRLPANVPAKDCWSIVLYDNQTRSQLQTDHPFPSISSQHNRVKANEDGSTYVWFGPVAPFGKDDNWVQTWPGKGWNVVLRLYGPLASFFDKTWRPGEIEEIT